ncbi:MAG: 2-isopropylmalate synthase, partial [Nanoarchaeota archaeon]
FAKLAESAGANRFSIADSLGLAAPDSIRKYIHDLRKEVKLGLEVHLHNDLGLATANSLSAYESGVEVVDVSILGIGERAGITPLEDFAVLLYKLKGDHVGDLSMIMPMCEMVSKYAGIPINPMKQIVGANAFKHTARLHRLAVDQDPTCYEFIDPEILGLSSYQATTTQLLENLIGVPFVRGAEELIGHRNGQGTRHVFMDNRVIPGSSFYIIIRDVDDIDSGLPGHVDMHSHNCDSAFLFVGKNPDFSGLSCEVYLGDLTKKVDSPASVFIPNGIPHAYRLVSGSGFYINILSTTDYNPATETVRK